MKSIMQGIQQLLPLLTVSIASAADVSAAVADLQRRAVSLQGSSFEAAAHLSHLQAAVSTLAAPSATSAQVEECIATLHASMMHMHDAGVAKVLEGSAALQQQLAAGIAGVLEAVDMLQHTYDSFSRQMLALQQGMSADLKVVMECLASLCGMAGSGAQAMLPKRIRAVRGRPIAQYGISWKPSWGCWRACFLMRNRAGRPVLVQFMHTLVVLITESRPGSRAPESAVPPSVRSHACVH